MNMATLLLLIVFNGPACSAQLNVDQKIATAGYFTLNWTVADKDSALLQQSSDPDFTQFSEIPVTGSSQISLSGFEDGIYYYRLANVDGVFSNTVTVAVEHHSFAKAMQFFAMGSLLFIVLICFLLAGYKKSKVLG